MAASTSLKFAISFRIAFYFRRQEFIVLNGTEV